jgi:5-methylcytosine-specific restriction protein A
MPMRPPRRCPTCRQLVTAPCPTCSRQRNRTRGSATSRGYGSDWEVLREWHLNRHPLCVFCEQRGETVVADEVDHIIPFVSIEVPRRLDPSNLRSLCKSCHSKHTRQQPGVSHHQPSAAGDRRPFAFSQGQFEGGRE